MAPSIGRIVHYTLSEGDVASIDRDMPAYPGQSVKRNSVQAGDVYPAIVVRVFPGGTEANGVCNLQVLLDGNCSFWATSRVEGEGESRWFWPPRV